MNCPTLKGQLLSRSLMLAAVFVAASGIFFVPDARASFSETLTPADVGTSFSVDWNYASNTASGGSLTSPLTALGTFTVDSLSSTSLVLSATIDNTTALNSKLTQAYLMSLGIGSTPTGTASITTAGSVFNAAGPGAGPNETFPGGFKDINACIFDSGGGCAGQKIQYGLGAGSSDSFVLALDGTFGSSPSITLSDFAVKFQTNEGSYEFGGNSLSETPEPGTLLLFGSALLLTVGPAIRRRFVPAALPPSRG
jgi:hypothetical protein